jgi:hypothetical protein
MDVDLLENWLILREIMLHVGNLGDTIAEVDDLIRKHEDFEKTVQAQEEKFNALQHVTMVGSHFVCVCVSMSVSVLTAATMLHCCSAKLACVQVCVCICIFIHQNVGKHIFLAV